MKVAKKRKLSVWNPCGIDEVHRKVFIQYYPIKTKKQEYHSRVKPKAILLLCYREDSNSPTYNSLSTQILL